MRKLLRLVSIILAAALLGYGIAAGTDDLWLVAVYAAAVPIGYLIYSLLPRQTVGWRRNVWAISATVMLGFVLLSLQLLRQQFIVAPVLASRPIPAGTGGTVVNPRVYESELRVQRGRIFDRNGVELAGRVVSPNGLVRRTYPVASTSYIIGYHTPSYLYGNAGLEERFNEYLSGQRGNPIGQIKARMLHRPLVGDDLHLTLDSKLQTLAQRLLGNRSGAIVVMDPRNGQILAMVSNPAYDAAELSYDPTKPRSEEVRRIQRAYERIVSSGDARLLNRATQGLYSPGSTFKTVTAAAALDTGTASPNTVYEDDGSYVVNGYVILDPNRPDKSRTKWTLEEAYEYSLNAVFAQVGLKLGAANMQEYGRRFMYDRQIPFDLPVTKSQLVTKPGFLSDPVALASSAFGQGQILATPLEILLDTATIANDGVMPSPYLVSEIKNPQGQVVYSFEPQPLSHVVSPRTAQQMKDMMVAAVEHGSGFEARIPGIEVAGKTGTAQLGKGKPHAWFTAFAPADHPKVAVVVLVEHGGEGYSVAAPIARQLIEAALNVREQP